MSSKLFDCLAHEARRQVLMYIPLTITTTIRLFQVCQNSRYRNIKKCSLHNAAFHFIIATTKRSIVYKAMVAIDRYVVYKQG